MSHKNKKKKNFKRGFLLLEMIVALGIFISVMTLGMGAILAMYGTNKKTQSLKAVMNNLNFSLDSMSREISVAGRKDELSGAPNEAGSSLWCDNFSPSGNVDIPKDCPLGGTNLTFCTFEGNRILYRFSDTGKSIERKFIPQTTSECPDIPLIGSANWERITAPEVTVNNMKFYVTGAANDDSVDPKQPKVLLVIQGEAGINENAKSKFEIQTTLSQRIPDLSILFN